MNEELDDRSEPLSAREREAFAALPRERQPRPALEDALVAELKRKRLVRTSRSRSYAAAAAAAVVLAAGAWWAGRTSAPTPPAAKWILLLHDAPASGSVPREESERRVQEYGRWARDARARGLIDGDKLGDDGTWLHATPSGVESRPLGAGEDPLGGFFLLGQMDQQAARDLALSCPHLRYGGVLELRRVDI